MSSQLIISGVIDGGISGGLPKAVELFALSDIADLSVYGIGSANNGEGTDGEEFTFPYSDSAMAGDYITIASESTEFLNFFGYAPDYTSNAAQINGDDAIELFFNGAVVDVFGEVTIDGSGEPWDYEDGWARRIDGSVPSGSTFQLTDWIFSGENALDGCTANGSCSATPPFQYNPSTQSVPFQSFTVPAPACDVDEEFVSFCAAKKCEDKCDGDKIEVCLGLGIGKHQEKGLRSSFAALHGSSMDLCVPFIVGQALIAAGYAQCGSCLV